MKSQNKYKSLDTLPIGCYNNIQKSIAAGKPEYRWLLDFDFIFGDLPEYENIQELKEIYESLTYQFDELDLNMYSLYIKSKRAFVKFNQKELQIKIADLENQEREINGLKQIKVNRINTLKGNVYHTFDEYRKKLNNDFTDFKFIEFYIDTENKILKDFIFYTEHQLICKLNFHNLEINEKDIKHQEKTFIHVDFLHKYLYDFYEGIGQLNEFFKLRLDFFDLNNLRCKPKQVASDLDENIMSLNNIFKNNYDKWELTVKQYHILQKKAIELNRLQASKKR